MGHNVHSIFPYILTIIGLVIALFQFLNNRQMVKLNKQKVKWDLFEKRYNIYKLTKGILMEFISSKPDNENKLREFSFSINEGVFLFDEDINGYIQLIITNGIELILLEKRASENKEWDEHSEKSSKLYQFFLIEYNKNVEKRFMRYLNFQNLT